MASLPYVTSPGNIEKALNGIQAAATPPTVSQDFVKNILKISGGSGTQITSYLKKIGFAGSDGKPTQRYIQFRNRATAGRAAAEAVRDAYGALYTRNEYMHTLSDSDLKGLIIEETGAAEDSSVPSLILAAINSLKSFARFDLADEVEELADKANLNNTSLSINHTPPPSQLQNKGVGLNLGYTINLNLPATSDVSVFNAIFKSLKEHLLKEV